MPGKYFGKYRGVVVDNSDPEGRGRLRVRVPDVTRDEVMWAEPALPYGVFFVPEVEMNVWIEYEAGDTGLALWTGIQSVPGKWPTEAQASPPKKRVIKTAAGHLIILNDISGEEAIEIKSNTHIVIRCLGTIEIQASNIIINGRAVVPGPRPI